MGERTYPGFPDGNGDKQVNNNTDKLYWRFQFVYWAGYTLLNLVYARAWGTGGQLYAGIFLLLSLMLFGVTHALRGLYRRHGRQRSSAAVGLHLVWLLPLIGTLVQLVFTLMIWAATSKQSLSAMAANRFGSTTFLAYSINTAIILLMWCLVCLVWVEWRRRQDAEREHWQNQVKLKELELQFLRSQINSHFLFNTLNNIRALVLEDASAARQAMTDLATLLRGVLQEGRSPVGPLQQELELVKGYLALEALQLEGRLRFELDIHSSLAQAQVPPMLLQTLVENAIRHGIARRSAGGTVHISAQPAAAGKWRMQVTNPPAEAGTKHAGHGIGLANARERLRIAFGAQATLELIEATSVIATVEMPLWTS